ncbi:MAG: ABC transporter substrate-binding protein [Microbacteriaceae bacterium]|nr:ABC transporter substrate-binding protein [Burkholderiaceae bacterium]
MRTPLLLLVTAALLSMTVHTAALAQDKVTFATNWKAQAAHGGFYQALADGTYKKYGLDVTIQPGGPQVNNRPLLPAGRIDFLMTGNLLHSFDNVKNSVPTVVVAAMFQKDPQALMAHPGQGYETFENLKSAPLALIAKDGQFSWWQWLKVTHGFKDEALKPYTYNLAPFLANPKAIQQGYSVAEPIYIENQGKFKPVVHLLADHGFSTYSTVIEARTETVKSKPELVQRFVDASTLGWVNYLYGTRQAANAMMIKENPEMTEAEVEASVALMKRQGIVDSGEAAAKGIGAMNAARIKDFYEQMVKAGLYKPGEVDLAKVATFQFINKGVGQDVKARLSGK